MACINEQTYQTKNTNGEVCDDCLPFDRALNTRTNGLGIGATDDDDDDDDCTQKGINAINTMLERMLQGYAAAARVPWQLHFSILWFLNNKNGKQGLLRFALYTEYHLYPNCF